MTINVTMGNIFCHTKEAFDAIPRKVNKQVLVDSGKSTSGDFPNIYKRKFPFTRKI